MGTTDGSLGDDDGNPLLRLSEVGERLPFDDVRPEHVQPAMQRLMTDARMALGEITQSGEAPTWDSVVEALEASTESLTLAFSVISHLESVRTTPELRSAYNATKPDVSAFFASIPPR